MVNRKRLVHEFITLLKIDSESGNEKAISDYLIRKLTDMDLIVIEDNYRYNKESSSGNIVATLETMSVSRNHPSIFFVPIWTQFRQGEMFSLLLRETLSEVMARLFWVVIIKRGLQLL